MAICPFAVKKLIPPSSSDPKITARLGIWHVDGGNAESLYNWFNGPSGGIESHFFISQDGTLEQYRDTAYQADANYGANDFALSCETQGFGQGSWTDAQIAMSKRLMVWMHETHGIKWQKAASATGVGFGYHTQFPQWTNVPGKICPGPDRIVQFNKILVPWIEQGGKTPAPGTPHITDALNAKNEDDRKAALQAIVRNGDDQAANAATAWLKALRSIDDARKVAGEMRSQLKDLRVS